MMIYCSICRHTAQSSKPPDQAQSDVMLSIGKHITEHHPEEARSLAADIEVCNQLVAAHLMRQFVIVPNDETALLDSLSKVQQSLLDLLKLEPYQVDLETEPITN